jgi:hypothetical protein
MMEAVSTSETSVNFYQTTRRNIPENSYLQTRHRKNLKSHQMFISFLNYLKYNSYLTFIVFCIFISIQSECSVPLNFVCYAVPYICYMHSYLKTFIKINYTLSSFFFLSGFINVHNSRSQWPRNGIFLVEE